MGLLDVNMPMLYGEGKKAFHRFQLEIICTSNDQSIFAWDYCDADNMWTGSILADDPSFFHGCGEMELMGHNEFIEFFKEDILEEELHSIEDQLGSFPVMNRGIQIWLHLSLKIGSRSHFRAWLPCRYYSAPWGSPMTIELVLWESNYYRCVPYYHVPAAGGCPQLRQVYLRYQDQLLHHNMTLQIDDSTLVENGFTCCHAYPEEFTGDTLTLTSTNSHCAKVYSDSLTNHRLIVGFGQSVGKSWIRVISEELLEPLSFNLYFTRWHHESKE